MRHNSLRVTGVIVFLFASLPAWIVAADPRVDESLKRLGTEKGVCVVLGPYDANKIIEIARASELLIYVQSPDREYVDAIRRRASQSKLLGTRIYAEPGEMDKIHLADNLADGIIVAAEGAAVELSILKPELLRVLHPGANALIGNTVITKPRPDGADDWSHPYHGPDNNPSSTDVHATAPYLTQFLAEPWYTPMPQVTVASGGRLFKAFGHIALKEREWPWLNTLVAINGFNGTQLWKRELTPGFMIHRNTLIATPEVLYLADDQSCKLLDAATGKLKSEIKIPADVDADGVWKWMALDGDVLYVLVGKKEPLDKVIRGSRLPAGWPWSDLGDGYAGEYQWGFGRTLLAIDPKTKKIKWTYQSADPIDSRAMCLAAGRIFVYSHSKFLASVDIKTGDELWKTTDAKLLAAIGQHDRAQTASKGFASSAYAKANDKGIYFAGPQRTKLVGVSARDGSLMWEYTGGNFQLVLREDGLYAMGRMETSKKFDYLTGSILADLECYRGNCTRATATVDSIFTRGYRHTGTMRLDLSGNEPRRIPLMRPACQDGVIVSEGQLYWGPWMCDCNHSLVGMIALAPAGKFEFNSQASDDERLESTDNKKIAELKVTEIDWPSYRGNVARSASSVVSVADKLKVTSQLQPNSAEPTAPVAAGGMFFWSGLDGAVHAADAADGKLRWTAFTGGAVRFPPEIWNGRVYVGSGDGYVYCFEATTGQQRWRFRAAPADRKIMVHGALLSNWPVGSGVLVHDGVVYAAAGISSYDGTHVYALDAETGKMRWQNNTSGRLVDNEQVTGVSVQGHLLLHNRQLYLAGGNVVSPAIYDIDNGKCLNKLENEWWSKPDDAKERFPSKPETEMFKRSPRGRELFLVDGTVQVFDQLLYSPPKYGPSRYFGGHFLQANNNETTIRATDNRIVRLGNERTPDGKPIGLWQNESFSDPIALALCKNAVLVAGQVPDDGKPSTSTEADAVYELAALNLNDGKRIWSHDLPARPVSWGLALDHNGQVIVTLVDGRVICFGK